MQVASPNTTTTFASLQKPMHLLLFGSGPVHFSPFIHCPSTQWRTPVKNTSSQRSLAASALALTLLAAPLAAPAQADITLPQAVLLLEALNKKGTFINIETGPIRMSKIEPYWDSARWIVEMAPGNDNRVRLQNRWTGCYLAVIWLNPVQTDDDNEVDTNGHDGAVYDTRCTTKKNAISDFEFHETGNGIEISRKDKSCFLQVRNGELKCISGGYYFAHAWRIHNAKQDGDEAPYQVSNEVARFIPN
jgi:hypothetical protein